MPQEPQPRNELVRTSGVGCRRLGRNLSTLAPLLIGAVAGAEVNRRATRDLGAAVVAGPGQSRTLTETLCKCVQVHVGVLGGTGPAGRGLAARLASVGIDVTIGSRSVDRAKEICDELTQRWPAYDLKLAAGDNAAAAGAEVVVVATPWDAAAATAKSVAELLAGKVVISMANALAKVGDEFQPLGAAPRVGGGQRAGDRARVARGRRVPPPAGQGTGRPRSSEWRATSSSAPTTRRPPRSPPSSSASSRACARSTPAASPMRRPIEAFAAVLLQLNVRYRTRAAVQLTGIDAT